MSDDTVKVAILDYLKKKSSQPRETARNIAATGAGLGGLVATTPTTVAVVTSGTHLAGGAALMKTTAVVGGLIGGGAITGVAMLGVGSVVVGLVAFGLVRAATKKTDLKN